MNDRHSRQGLLGVGGDRVWGETRAKSRRAMFGMPDRIQPGPGTPPGTMRLSVDWEPGRKRLDRCGRMALGPAGSQRKWMG